MQDRALTTQGKLDISFKRTREIENKELKDDDAKNR